MGSPDELPLVTDSDLDPGFADRVRATPGGEGILHCYACGTCSASCPIRAIDDEFNPRRIIRLALLGLKDEVLTSQFIWLCTGCFICQERCPQDVRITDLMMASLDAGFSLSSQIRQDPRSAGIPIILVTAAGSQRGFDFRPRTAEDLAAMNVDAFFEKPVSTKALLSKVRELIETRSGRSGDAGAGVVTGYRCSGRSLWTL